MSAKGNLATGDYTRKNVEAARRFPEFVMGFVAMRRVDEREETAGGVAPGEGVRPSLSLFFALASRYKLTLFLARSQADYVIMTPGVGLDSKGDGMGQQYRTPDEVVNASGCDIIIVGRGIYGGGEGNADDEIVRQSKRYQEAGWKAYLDRLEQ